MSGEVGKRRYAKNKPKECKYCYFWGGKKKGCNLGGIENCDYLIREEKIPVKKTKCDDCPYKKNGPCPGKQSKSKST